MNDETQSKGTTRRPVRPVSQHVHDSLAFDVWPTGPACLQDFGLASDEHYGALQFAVREHGVTAEELDEALGNGEALTALIRPGNPYFGVRFATPWDTVVKQT